MDPLGWANAGLSFVSDLIKIHKLNEWAKLIFSFTLSWFVTTTGACGAALLAHQSVPVAVGSGLVSGAGCLIYLARKSDKTKGMMFAYSLDIPANMTSYQAEKK